MRKLDYEFIFTCGIVAFIAALGMVAGIVVLAGAKIYVYNLPLIVGSFRRTFVGIIVSFEQ